jgi:hypothetical protein
MPEIVILTCPATREVDERFALVAVDVSTARVQRVSEVLSGEALRTLLRERGEPSWCIAARIAMARQQIADVSCLDSELAPKSLPLRARGAGTHRS